MTFVRAGLTSKADVVDALRQDGPPPGSGGRRFTLRNALVVTQVASAVTALIGGLRTLAQDHGTSIDPGVKSLMKAMGVADSTVRAGLRALQQSGVLLKVGTRLDTAGFKSNLERLATYEPPLERTRAGWRVAARQRDGETTAGAASRQTSSGPHVP